ncbi:conjugative transposon protein TraM [Pontibacter saemangeumensis]|uniref:Conjugative transposon protein TraM n=2 Tax=Pontibacter saemangeumensis TaxID=1084525 RepID=A0ABP8LHP2_9BACT
MVLPLLALPFVTLLFWALGGGREGDASAQGQAPKGFNMALPDAYLKEEEPLDKLSYYKKAASDSARLNELLKNDPYYQQQMASGPSWSQDTSLPEGNYKSTSPASGSRLNTSPYSGAASQDQNEAKVYRKLEQLNAALQKAPVMSGTKAADDAVYPRPANSLANSNDLDRLEQMMHMMSQEESGDPEMQQLNIMLEKILDIQHPQRVREKIRQTSEARKGQVLAVAANGTNDPVSLLDNTRQERINGDTSLYHASQQNGFYSWDEATAVNARQNGIAAVVHETHTVVTGSTVKLRLTGDVYINGILVPEDNFVFGMASLDGERLHIHVNSIRYQNSLFPVDLSVYDMDGLEGIYIPGAITGEVARQSADRVVQDIGFTTLDPSLEVQAASAGVEAAKSLFSKKAKLVKVTVKAGYQVLLRDEKQQQGN